MKTAVGANISPKDAAGRSRPGSTENEIMNKARHGSTLEAFLEEEGIKEDIELLVQKKLLSAKIEKAMARLSMSQKELAKAMKTSRTVVHRLLDPQDTSVTLATLSKASKALGVRLLRVA
jgi:antitoxin HicB